MSNKLNAPGIARLDPFAALADVYQIAGMAEYSKSLAPRLLDLAFEMDWTGRTLLELGCGTGDAACWFSERSFRVIALDTSAAMLRRGEMTAQASGLNVEFTQGDMRTFQTTTRFEMITCLGGVLNYLSTLR